MSHSLRAKLSGLRYKGLLTDEDYQRLKKALDVVDGLQDVIAEIIEEKEYAYADFEQYKVDILGVDSEYVEDELPYDDFRYGMERCLEIIDKHTKKNTRHLKYAGNYADQDTMMPTT